MATIEISSGLILDIENPDLSALTVYDVYNSLSKLCRFNGHGSMFYDVASHSVNCTIAAEMLGFDYDTIRRTFLHDYSEILLGDVPNPARILLPDFCALEAKIDKIFENRFDIRGSYDKMKEVDYAMAKLEAYYLMPSKGMCKRWHEPKHDLSKLDFIWYGLMTENVSRYVFLYYCDKYGVR